MLRESIAAVESLMAIGLDQIEQVDADLRHAVVLCGPRRMPVRLHVGSPVSVQSALPVPFAAVNDPCDLLDSLNSLVQRLEPFWKRFDALDANTRVLDPIEYSDPLSSEEIPALSVFGSHKEASKYTHLLSYEHLASHWTHEHSIQTNLENILGFRLPSPDIEDTDMEEDDDANTCGICMSFALPMMNQNAEKSGQEGVQSIPERSCDKCGRLFHAYCLQEWLRGLPGTRFVFGTLIGECLYCKESISVPSGDRQS
ncbi:MAG: hypothetical protein SGCHY_002184 [Lobulomycetales sp.]